MCENEKIGVFDMDGNPMKFVPPEEPRVDMEVPFEIVAMLREAKEKHLPVMITNDDNTRALLIKDANTLKCKISINGIPFEEI